MIYISGKMYTQDKQIKYATKVIHVINIISIQCVHVVFLVDKLSTKRKL